MENLKMTNIHRKYPFQHMRLGDYAQILGSIVGRNTCPICQRSRKFFCYTCYELVVGDIEEKIPKVEIPIKDGIDIIKHKKEIDGKSTAVHAKILAKEKVKIYTYPEIPDYSNEEGVVLIFPCATSLSIAQLFNRNVLFENSDNHEFPKGFNNGTMLRFRQRVKIIDEGQSAENSLGDEDKNILYNLDNLPIRKAVIIDSTWNQCRGIYKDKRLHSLPTINLQNRFSQFWRHQKKSPRWYLATIEAIHQFVLEVHVNAWGLNPHYRGLDNLEIDENFFETVKFVEADECDVQPCAPYNGQYDGLMFFFANMYDLIHKYYDHNELKSYKRPI